MTKVRFNPPLQWENWCGWLLAIWLCISPGPLKFGDDLTATYVAVLSGIVLICTEMLTISPFRLWEEWINVLVGGWLIAASWLLHLQNPSAKINFVVVGALVAIFAVYKLWFGVGDKQGAI
ncbi:MAG TPA: SPW repeat protein, partial [Pseudolabrys sp.]|nr:SPW repeat protein [Pseudolabrys sp.]